jgi:site-specific recombinase XerD
MTIEAVIKKDKPNKKGECPIAIRLNDGNRKAYHSLGIRIHPDNWNGRVYGCKLAAHYNNLIDKKIHDLRASIMAKQAVGEDVGIDTVKAILNPNYGGGGDFLALMSEVVVNKVNAGTRRRYGSDYSELMIYCNGKLTFADITPAWLSRYQKHLLTKVEWETMRNRFKIIRHVFNEANKQGLTSLNPFKEWQYPNPQEQKTKVYLTRDETTRLRKYLDICPDEYKAILAYFLVECYSGIRYSDWGKQRIERDGSRVDMILRTTKTGTEVRLPVDAMPELLDILNYIEANGVVYRFSLPHTNRVLKLIAAAVGIKKPLTTHVGRHTAASNMMNMDGLSERTIAELLGISVKVLVSTYAHFSADKVRREFERLRK